MTFRKIKQEEISHTPYIVTEYVHEDCEMVHVHIQNKNQKNQENAMSFFFNTLPNNSKGVAHILEHCVLLGSEKYPLKNPFLSMNRNSVSTFMNAMTSADYTEYVFGSKLEKDFKNIMSVYMDAVFFPLIRAETFHQEGFRLAIENDKIVLQGVVYNEMKGAFSSSLELRNFFKDLAKELAPNSIYENDSGGHPSSIPFVTHQDVIEFHKKYYQPSNCKVVTYGSIDAQYYQDCFEEVIDEYKKRGKLKFLAEKNEDLEMRVFGSDIKNFLFPFKPNQIEQAVIIYQNENNKAQSIKDSIEKKILIKYLFDDQTCYMQDQFIKSKIPGILLDNIFNYSFNNISFIGMKIQDCQNPQLAIDFITGKIEEIKENFKQDNDVLNSILNNLEKVMKKQNYGSKGVGVSILLNSNGILSHEGGNFIFDLLNNRKYLEEIRQDIKNDENYIQNMVKKYFKKDNCLKMIGTPDLSINLAIQEKESDYIDKINQEITKDQKEKIKALNDKILAFNQKDEDESILKRIEVEDIVINKETKELTIKDNKIFGEAFTNGVNTLTLSIELPELNIEEKALLNILPQINHLFGTNKMAPYELGKALSSRGLKIIHNIGFSHDYKNNVSKGFLSAGIEYLDVSHKDIITYLPDVIFDQNFYHKESMIFAMNMLRNDFIESKNDWFKEIISTSIQVNNNSALFSYELNNEKVLREYERLLNLDVDLIMHKIQNLYNKIHRNKNSYKMFFIGENEKEAFLVMNEINKKIEEITQNDEKQSSNKFYMSKPDNPLKFVVSDDNINSLYFNIPYVKDNIEHKYESLKINEKAALKVLISLIDNQYIHQEVREKGGAYGGYAKFTGNSILLISYRDPQFIDTINVFKNLGQWFENFKKSENFEERIKEAKLSALSEIDPLMNDIMLVQMTFKIYEQNMNIGNTFKVKELIKTVSKQEIIDVFDKYIALGLKNAKLAGKISKKTYLNYQDIVHEWCNEEAIVDLSEKEVIHKKKII